MKLLTIFWISDAYTSCPGFSMHSSQDNSFLVIIHANSLAFFDGVVWQLLDGVDILLLAGVVVGVVIFESVGPLAASSLFGF